MKSYVYIYIYIYIYTRIFGWRASRAALILPGSKQHLEQNHVNKVGNNSCSQVCAIENGPGPKWARGPNVVIGRRGGEGRVGFAGALGKQFICDVLHSYMRSVGTHICIYMCVVVSMD